MDSQKRQATIKLLNSAASLSIGQLNDLMANNSAYMQPSEKAWLSTEISNRNTLHAKIRTQTGYVGKFGAGLFQKWYAAQKLAAEKAKKLAAQQAQQAITMPQHTKGNNMGFGTFWAQARDSFYKKTGITKKLPAILGQRAGAFVNKKPALTTSAQPVQTYQNFSTAAQPATASIFSGTTLYWLAGALVVAKIML